MSDLSGLNPTPHAIAVYASSPLSPVATQHSLPSGRYSLLGPDFHRLDRTSLRLAHSFDHLVGAGEQRRWRAQRTVAMCHSHFQSSSAWRTYTLDTHFDPVATVGDPPRPQLATHRHVFPQSSSSSRFTAGASEFFILSQSGERP